MFNGILKKTSQGGYLKLFFSNFYATRGALIFSPLTNGLSTDHHTLNFLFLLQ